MPYKIGKFLRNNNTDDESGIVITFYNEQTHRRAEMEILDNGWVWLTMYANREAPEDKEIYVFSNQSDEGSIPITPSEMYDKIQEYLK